MVLAGMLPWTFFSTALGDASNSLVTNANLVSKVYFPRLIIPTATVVVAFVDMMISFAILVVHDGLVPLRAGSGTSCCCRSSSLLAFLASLGPGLWITALNVQVSRFPLRHSVRPAVRPLCLAGRLQRLGRSGEWRLLYSLNPDGRRHRRLPLVHPGRREPRSTGRASVSIAVIAFFLWLGIRRSGRWKKALRI